MKNEYERDGFLVLRNFLSHKVYADALRGMELWHGEMPINNLHLMDVMFSSHILDVARELLGKKIVFYGEQSVNYEKEIGPVTKNVYTAPHFDAPVETDIVLGFTRFAIYTQDYTKGSGGLQIARGSHVGIMDYYPSSWVSIGAKPLDLVVWNLRCLHKAGEHLALHPSPPGPRNAIFFDFGASGDYGCTSYIQWRASTINKKRALPAKGWGSYSDYVKSVAKYHTVELDSTIPDAIVNYLTTMDKESAPGVTSS